MSEIFFPIPDFSFVRVAHRERRSGNPAGGIALIGLLRGRYPTPEAWPAEDHRYSIREYVGMEEKAAIRHEFHDGEILVTSGGTSDTAGLIRRAFTSPAG